MARIEIEHFDNGVSVYTLCNEKKLNAISKSMAIEMQDAFQAFDADKTRKVAIITSKGNESFSSGADLDDLPEIWRCTPRIGITTNKPIIAAVSGWCVGGGLVMTMMSDLAVAADNTKFSYPEGKVGITQGFITGLINRVPFKAAMEIMLLGQTVTANRALEMGLINKVVPVGQQLAAAKEMADYMATLAPMVLETLKKFANELLPQSLSVQYASIKSQLDRVSESNDFAEGLKAFKEKRQAVFNNS